jgi:transcriptional regulator with XRE-family HTH domain
MDDRRLGRAVRARRHQRGWRLEDLAIAAGVGPGVCGLLERGDVAKLSVRTARAIVAAVDLPLSWDIGWQRQEIERLLDADHSTLAAQIALDLEAGGWLTRSEVSFNHFGERGRIDIVAFHRPSRILLVIEVKTVLVDAQDLLGTLDAKARIAPTAVADLGWDRPAFVVPAIILAEGSTVRRHVERLEPLLRRYELRGRAANAWLANPVIGPTGLLIYRTLPIRNGVDRRRAGRRRVRLPRSARATR